MKHARLFVSSIAIFALALSGYLLCKTNEKPMVVVIPSYNNVTWCEKNVASVLAQNYSNFRIIYVDDCSKDGTYQKVKEFVDAHNAWDKVTLIGNKERCGAMANWYNTIHNHCKDEEIVINLDGDDWLANDDVLTRVNKEYQNKEVWLTYGQFVEYPYGKECGYVGFPREVIENNSFRRHGLPMSHLRTYYAWLFKKVKKEDFLLNGEFLEMTCDKAMLLPMVEMCGGRFSRIKDVLYIYNCANPIRDCAVDGKKQWDIAHYLYAQTPYEPLEEIIVRNETLLAEELDLANV